MMEPVIKLFLEENPDVEYQKVDVDTEFDIAREYDVMSVPTFVGLINGEVSNRVLGAVPKARIEELYTHPVEPHFDSGMIKETDAMGREMFWKDAGRP